MAAYIWAMLGGLLYYTSYLIVRKPYMGVDPGDMMTLMMAMMLGTQGISSSLSMLGDFNKAQIAAAKVLDIIYKKPKYDRHDGANDMNGEKTICGKIEFRDVGFKYATRNTWAVRHLSFVIEPGETVAFVGESGCGKSTTLQLLQRFYEVTEGEILIDDVSIQELSPIFVRNHIASVPQGPVLFSMSIRDNLRYARPDAADVDVAAAAVTGNAHDFIMEQPMNYETSVQQTSLSGGQKQRICISRAILVNAPILLLDEATAALDTESEQLVQQSLESVRHGKTAVVVAHRLATVLHADRILVFREGHIAESGKHEELLEQSGMYADLVKYQLE
jgi:ABC-type multidrug transport system fused ATPase/permease subunit